MAGGWGDARDSSSRGVRGGIVHQVDADRRAGHDPLRAAAHARTVAIFRPWCPCCCCAHPSCENAPF